MAKGASKLGGGAGGKVMDYDDFLKLNDEQQLEVIDRMIKNVKVPSDVKDTPTMRVMVGLGIDGKPKMVDEATLNKTKGTEIYRTVDDAKNYNTGAITMTSDAIVKQFTQSNYTSLSDVNGSSEGRGYYFADDLWGAVFWGNNNAKTMRAKVDPKAKLLDIDNEFFGKKTKNSWKSDDAHRDVMNKNNVLPWDDLTIWAIRRGYKGGIATDSGTGVREHVIYDRSILTISKNIKNTKKNKDVWGDKSLKWKDI